MKPVEFESVASEMAMALWNRLAHSPHFNHLRPRDYPDFYEAVEGSLKSLADKDFLRPLHKPQGHHR